MRNINDRRGTKNIYLVKIQGNRKINQNHLLTKSFAFSIFTNFF